MLAFARPSSSQNVNATGATLSGSLVRPASSRYSAPPPAMRSTPRLRGVRPRRAIGAPAQREGDAQRGDERHQARQPGCPQCREVKRLGRRGRARPHWSRLAKRRACRRRERVPPGTAGQRDTQRIQTRAQPATAAEGERRQRGDGEQGERGQAPLEEGDGGQRNTQRHERAARLDQRERADERDERETAADAQRQPLPARWPASSARQYDRSVSAQSATSAISASVFASAGRSVNRPCAGAEPPPMSAEASMASANRSPDAPTTHPSSVVARVRASCR